MVKISLIRKVLLSFLIAISFTACEKPASSFSSAQELIKKEDYKGAIEILDRIILEKPAFDSAYIERAYAYMMVDDIPSSLEDYNHVMPNPAFQLTALSGRGLLYYNAGEYSKAIEDYSKIIQLDRENFHAYYARAVAKTQLWHDESGKTGNYDDKSVLDDFNRSIRLNDSCVDCYVKRGDLYMKINESEKALADYNSAIHIDSTFFDAYFSRALLYKDLKNVANAMSDFNKAIQLDPKNPFPYANRAYLKLGLLNDKTGACEDFKMAENLGLPLGEEAKKNCN